jgi:AraC-like DNA-binding protein
MAFYESVCSGNLETVKTLFTPLGGEGFGKLSEDPIRNLKYHLVISIAMVTRFCINGGMTPEEAYSLSDVYIQRTDICHTEEEVHQVHYQMTIEFTKRMRQIRNGHVYSKTMIRILDYIGDHLHEKIRIQEIARHVSRTEPYISRLFHAEMGIPVSTYIMQKKIEAAANLLQFSDYSALEISNYLNFSSQSYFIKQFKKQIGITPKEYRSRYDTVGWFHPTENTVNKKEKTET